MHLHSTGESSTNEQAMVDAPATRDASTVRKRVWEGGERMTAAFETPSRSKSLEIVSAVADHLEREPIDLDPLYHSIDPDAIDSLFDTSASSVPSEGTRVTFTYERCEVTVTRASVDVSSQPNAATASGLDTPNEGLTD
ncbi:hypothetical protein OB919_07490 [Halobacteria archaeon AArc-curdl1]|uniref:Halobacterial output domain-containing protein n=1 Tax=Natronosalvus hydrolyticus TaxID=2979988 RepID=A0AAP3E6C5_9EURY|nr:hypothetical protein [Halobacteria archaeon AArc-curdl1]